jgi:aspartyl-tRNA(Asn)/glutamyl-tRNA(Gln) amidotransferase subunit C
MKLTPEEIEQLAVLARLELTAKERKMYAEQISVVLDYMNILDEVDTTGAEETCQVTGLEDVVREDRVIGCEERTRAKLIEAFPEKQGDLLQVRGVFE